MGNISTLGGSFSFQNVNGFNLDPPETGQAVLVATESLVSCASTRGFHVPIFLHQLTKCAWPIERK